MNGKTGEPVSVWGTALGVAFSLLAGVGGVLLAMDREDPPISSVLLRGDD